MPIKCYDCGAENDDNAKFCCECGEEIGYYCAKCGAHNTKGKFCNQCGAEYIEVDWENANIDDYGIEIEMDDNGRYVFDNTQVFRDESGIYTPNRKVFLKGDYEAEDIFIRNGTRIICAVALCYEGFIEGDCDYDEYVAKARKIIIPNSVIVIGVQAFKGCHNLQSITIPNSVRIIGWGAFKGCTSLQSITIPDSITRIGRETFKGCTNLQSITLPDSVTEIGDEAFFDTEIYNNAANWNDNLLIINSKYLVKWKESENCVVIPETVIVICGGAFKDCTRLQSITIPDSVTEIGTEAFKHCTNLQSITISNSVTRIGDGAFSDCASLQSITIPNSVTKIGYFTFSGCTSLQSIEIPNSVTGIGWDAFEGCHNLQSIEIPNSATEIGWSAFEGCTSLQSITIPHGTMEKFKSMLSEELHHLLKEE